MPSRKIIGVSRSSPPERHGRTVLCGRMHSRQEDAARLRAGRIALSLTSKG